MSQIEDLSQSLTQYSDQLSMVTEALKTASSDERQSLIELQSELQELIKLTQESLEATAPSETPLEKSQQETEIDDEYALFMQEMAKSGAYDENTNKAETSNLSHDPEETNSDIEDDLSTLLGMKCAVYHTHKWGGQPSLHNAMVCAVVPRQDGDQFKDLQVNILFTHPTHAEMLPCPFYLDGECRFSNEQCRYSHGAAVQLSSLKDAIEPNFESIRVGSRVLLKLKPPDDEDISLTRKSSEKYHLWHRAVVKSVDLDNKTCSVRFEHGVKTGEKRKSSSDEVIVRFEDLFPLDVEDDADSDSGDSLSDTEYPENKCSRPESADRALLIERSLQNNAPSMGEWERHTRGIGSKLMLAMGYVPGTGLGASSDGRVAPVEARLLPVGKSLDHCMAITEKHGGQDALKVEQRLKRMQKKEEERNKRAYEREKEREKRDVFNILNKALGDKPEDVNATVSPITQIKQSTNKDLNIEQFKITEDTKKLEREILKLNSSLSRHSPGTGGFKTLNLQISEKTKELAILKSREQQISREQKQRKDKQKMTVF